MRLVTETHINVARHIGLIQGPKFWTFAATEWHRLYRPYCPFAEGALYNTVNIHGRLKCGIIEHTVPYAHYVYEGRVMGPNTPISQGGEIVGFFSPVAPKHYTGAMLHFGTMFSPKASRHWDEAAAPTQKPLLVDVLQVFVDSGALNFSGG